MADQPGNEPFEQHMQSIPNRDSTRETRWLDEYRPNGARLSTHETMWLDEYKPAGPSRSTTEVRWLDDSGHGKLPGGGHVAAR